MVKDDKVAWHAGKSKWKNLKFKFKIFRIELVNKGHKIGYENFTTLQIQSLIDLCKKLKKIIKLKKTIF